MLHGRNWRPIKKRLNRAIVAVANEFPDKLFRKIRISDATCPYHLEIFRRDEEKGGEIFKIRVTLDEITDQDRTLCRSYEMSKEIFTRFIACRQCDLPKKPIIYEKIH